MRRTALSIAAVFLTAAAYLYLFEASGVVLLSIGLLLTAIAVGIVGFRRFTVFKSVAVLVIGSLFSFYLAFFVQGEINSTQALINTEQVLTVRVIEEPKVYAASVSVLTETEDTDGTRLKLSIGNQISSAEIFEGDILKVRLKFTRLNQNYKKFNYTDKVYVSAYCTEAEVIGHRKTLYTYCIGLRRSIRNVIEEYTEGDVAALLEGVLLGDISLMSDELYEDFKITGVAHITAVSGMHIGALCVMVTTALSKLFGRRKAALLAMLPMALVVMLAGFTPSAVRSGIMCLIMLLAQVLLKKADGLNSLGVAIATMLCYNPFYICSLSFQLSCSAAAGVIMISPLCEAVAYRLVRFEIRFVSHVLRETVRLFVQSLGAVACTLPFQIVEFGFISLAAPIANIFICAASVYMMALTVLAVGIHFLPFGSVLAGLLFHFAEILARYSVVTVGILSEIPFSYIPFGSMEAVIWVALSVLLIAVWVLLGRPGRIRLIALLCVALLLLTLWTSELFSDSVIEIAALSVGNGLCTVISYNESCVIIGCGDDYSDCFILNEHLKQRGIASVELLLIPSKANTCFKGYSGVKESLNVKINTVAVPENIGELNGLEHAVRLSDRETLTVCNENIVITPIFTDTSCIYEVSVFGKRFAVSCYGFDAEKVGLNTVDFIITGRALPKNINCKLAVISAEAEEYRVDSAERSLVTGERTLSVKLKKGKGMTIYAQ